MTHSKIQNASRYLLKAIVVALLVAGSVQSRAQAVTATLFGTVSDSAGAAIAHATVTVTDENTGVVTKAESNGTGEYRIQFLQIGSYKVEISAPGFSKRLSTGVNLEAGRVVKIDGELTPGSVEQVVEVSEAAPLINTANAEVGTTVESVLVQELPILNLNPYALLDIIPGVQTNGTQTGFGMPEQHTQLNGGIEPFGSGNVNYFLDGGQNVTSLRNAGNILPAPESIAEFRVQATNFGAEYGRFAGGVINVITKSGTNNFKGSLYEYWRNDRLNARPWQAKLANPPMHRNQFGATLGGPIFKNRTFFFGSYAGLRETTAVFLNNVIVPSPAERNASGTGYDFSASAVKPTDPFNGNQPFSCKGVLNVICPSYHIDPVAIKLMNEWVPAGNISPKSWQGSVITPDQTDGFLAKIDHKLSAAHQIRGSYFNTSGYQYLDAGGSTLPYARSKFSWRQQNTNLSEVWVISPAIVNQAWLSWTKAFGARVSEPAKSLADYGSTFYMNGEPSLPYVNVSGNFFLGNQISGPTAGNNFYSLRDLASVTTGMHSLRVGAEGTLNKDEQTTNLVNYGQFTMNGVMTGNALTDFLLGIPSQLIQQQPVAPATNTFVTSFFAQDDYRVSPRVTLNLGFRWDIQTPPTDTADRLSTYIPGRTSTVRPGLAAGVLYPGDTGVPRGIVNVSYAHLAPRLGVAIDPFGNGKTAVRAGFGMFWGGVSGNAWNQPSNSSPFTVALSFPTAGIINGATLTDPYQNYPGGKPFPYTGNYVISGSTFLAIDRGFRWPFTYQMNASVQQQIGRTGSVTVAYVGTLSHSLPYYLDHNYPLPTPTATATVANIQSRRPNPNISSVLTYTSNINSNYHALQVTGEKRLSHGISFLSSYTYSKTLVGGDVQDYQTMPQNISTFVGEYGPANSDLRHLLSVAAVWQFNYLKGNRALMLVANGWQLSTIYRGTAGFPFNFQNGVDANLDGNLTDRPNVVGDYHVAQRTAKQWFNAAAFVQNKVVTGHPVDGNVSRNMLTGPPQNRVDVSMQRSFAFFEHSSLNLRVDATNVLNHVPLGQPGANLNATSLLGVITSMAGGATMRQLQLGAKIYF